MTKSRTQAPSLTRRTLLAGTGAATLLLTAPGILRASTAPRRLNMQSLNSGEKLNIIYWEEGAYIEKARDRIDWFMRDLRTGESTRMDANLLDFLWEIDQHTKSNAPISIMSAYRSPATNAKLASTTDGVDPASFHMRGMAIDVTQDFADPEAFFTAAKKLGRGGAGFYPVARPFVHVDVGPVDSWVHPQTGRPNRAEEYDRLQAEKKKSN